MNLSWSQPGRRWGRRPGVRDIADVDEARPPVGEGGGSDGVGGRTAGMPDGAELKRRIGTTALAFRGYDVANLGRSRELLEHASYGPTVRRHLEHASAVCSQALGAEVDLVEFVRAGRPTSLETFAHDIATIVAMEIAQVALLEEFFDVPARKARLSFGYSIGELSALVVGGVFSIDQILPVPLEMAADAADLAHDATMGVLFTKGPALRVEDVERLCLAIRSEGRGLIGPSAFLSPNTALLLGQGDTLDRLERKIPEYLTGKVMLRRKPHRWPPLHSPLVWRRHIPNRTAVALHRIAGPLGTPKPPVISCVTGEASYDAINGRDILARWTDAPQRLWDVIDETLARGVEVVLHVGPAPNLVPATFARLGNNVSRYLTNKYVHRLGREVVSGMNRYAWLGRLLPAKTSLLRAPYLVHVILEDWLLAQAVPRDAAIPGSAEIGPPRATDIVMDAIVGESSGLLPR